MSNERYIETYDGSYVNISHIAKLGVNEFSDSEHVVLYAVLPGDAGTTRIGLFETHADADQMKLAIVLWAIGGNCELFSVARPHDCPAYRLARLGPRILDAIDADIRKATESLTDHGHHL